MEHENLPSQVRCAHILLKHTGSRNPINRNTNQPVTRSKEEAIAEIKQHLESIKASATPDREFKNLAMRVSECSSARSGGDRSRILRPRANAEGVLRRGFCIACRRSQQCGGFRLWHPPDLQNCVILLSDIHLQVALLTFQQHNLSIMISPTN